MVDPKPGSGSGAPERDPGFVDTIFASGFVIATDRFVLLVAAVVLLFASLYTMISIGIRMARGQWLRRAGPFESELAEAERNLGEADELFTQWLEVSDDNARLLMLLEERDTTIEQLLNENDALRAELQQRKRWRWRLS